jgi:DNA-binding transcriptional MerR regulator
MDVRRSLTVGEISRRLNCPIHKVKYLINSRGIEPVERAGNLRVFSVDVLDLLRSELSKRCPANVGPVFASGAGNVQT